MRLSHNFTGESHFRNSLAALPQTIKFLKLAIFFAATPSLISAHVGDIKSAKDGSANRVKAKNHSEPGSGMGGIHDRHKTVSKLDYMFVP